MANTKQAKKRARQAVAHRGRNTAARSKFRTALKRVLAAIATKDKTKAREAYLKAVPVIDGAVTKGLIHKNKAARHKQALNTKIKALKA